VLHRTIKYNQHAIPKDGACLSKMSVRLSYESKKLQSSKRWLILE